MEKRSLNAEKIKKTLNRQFYQPLFAYIHYNGNSSLPQTSGSVYLENGRGPSLRPTKCNR